MAKLDGLHPYVKIKAEELLDKANKRLGHHKMIITQAHRSKAEQDELYAQGRTKKVDNKGKKLSIVTNAKGGTSYHNYGLAIDFALVTPDGKTAVWDTNKDFDKDGKADWLEIVEEAKKLGFKWGGDWTSFKDYPHLEITGGLTISQLQAGKEPNFPKVVAEKVEVKKDPVKTEPAKAEVKKVEPKKEVPLAIPAYPGIVFKLGSKGINVERIQRAVGFKEKDVSGTYDAKTVTAVKEYQKKKKLSVDGQVGPSTWNTMF